MSGHSKWHNIQAKKGKADAARGKIFTKLGRELLIAVKLAKEEFIRNLDGRTYCCPIPDEVQPDIEK